MRCSSSPVVASIKARHSPPFDASHTQSQVIVLPTSEFNSSAIFAHFGCRYNQLRIQSDKVFSLSRRHTSSHIADPDVSFEAPSSSCAADPGIPLSSDCSSTFKTSTSVFCCEALSISSSSCSLCKDVTEAAKCALAGLSQSCAAHWLVKGRGHPGDFESRRKVDNVPLHIAQAHKQGISRQSGQLISTLFREELPVKGPIALRTTSKRNEA